MKVLHILPSLDSSFAGGPVEAVIQLCQGLKNQGIEVAIATTIIDDKKNLNIPDLNMPDVNIHYFHRRFNSFLPLQFAFSPELKNWLKRHITEFDLLHIHYLFTYPSTIACYYADKYKIPYILRPTGMLSQFCLKKSAFKKKLYIQFFEKRYLRNTAAIHFTSGEEINSAIKLKLNNQHIIVPLGLNLERFKNVESSRGIFRKHYPQTNEKKIVLFLSRIDPKKGLDILIPALKILSKKRNDFVFVLAGSGYKNYERWVRRALAKAGLIESTILTGFIEGKMKFALLADADVFVLSSYDENFGIAVVEAMAAGLAVIISNRINIYNLIEGYQAGIVTALNSQEIALALDRLLSDERLRIEMGICGRKLVEENFDIREIAKKMLGIYSHLILKRGRKQEIRRYWESEVCGSRYGISENRIKWFNEIEQARYALEPHIPDFADFEEYRGKRIIEIGMGAGTDFINWVRNNAVAIGIDCSQAAVKLAKERLDLEGINTGTFGLCVADAENLPFKNNTFELVYAWGVLHHIPNTEMAIRELYRVLKPRGIVKVMIYHIPSWTGWMLWLRFSLFRLKPWVSVREAISKYLESPGTKAYTLQEARRLFENLSFQEVTIESVLGPGDLLYIRRSKKYQAFIYRIFLLIYPRWLVRLLGNRLGLELLVEAKK